MSSIRNNKLWRRISIFSVMAVVFSAAYLILPVETFAQTDFGVTEVEESIDLGGGDFALVVTKIIRALLGFLGLIAVIVVLYGGFTYMTAGGNEEKITKGKKILINGLIGLTIIFFSVAIVQFIISNISKATGLSDGSTKGGPNDCIGLECDEFPICLNNYFVVKSITPNQEKTGMNNIVARVVFNQALGSSPSEVMTVTFADGSLVNDFLTFSFVPGSNNKVVEARMDKKDFGGNNYCSEDNQNTDHCFRPQNYEIEISKDLVSTDGQEIEFDEQCGFGPPETAQFEVDVVFNDTQGPIIESIDIIDSEGQVFGPENKFKAGTSYIISSNITDDHGVGYVHLNISALDDGGDFVDIYDGPLDDSSQQFDFAHSQFFSAGIIAKWKKPKKYIITVEAWDIDHNVTTETSSFILIGENCGNGDQDEGEIDVDEGGMCGEEDGGDCEENFECASGFCPAGQCIALPQITNVDPMSGAPGNWVTISGKNFGDEVGKVQFGSDEFGWIDAEIVQCSSVLEKSWSDSFVIAEVPESTVSVVQDNGLLLGGPLGEAGYVDFPLEADQFETGFVVSSWGKIHGYAQGEEQEEPRNILSIGDENQNLSVNISKDYEIELIFLNNGEEKSSKSDSLGMPYFLQDWRLITLRETHSDEDLVSWDLFMDDQIYVSLENDSGIDFSIQTDPKVRLGASFEGNKQANTSYDEFVIYSSSVLPENYFENLADLRATKNNLAYQEYILSTNPFAYWSLHLDDAIEPEPPLPNQNGGDKFATIVGYHSEFLGGIFGFDPIEINLSEVAIRIVVDIDGVEYSDSTTDDGGPKPGGDGLFTINDTELPKLCSVLVYESAEEIPVGHDAAFPGMKVELSGESFGDEQSDVNGKVKFVIKDGQNQSFPVYPKNVYDWTPVSIVSEVPEGIQASTPLVHVEVDGKDSNGIPFKVLESDLTNVTPLINEIIPEAVTPGSFVTIQGVNFGSYGYVYLANSPNAACSPGSSDCITLDTTLPDFCDNSWTDTEIIVVVDEGIDLGEYNVIVQRGDNFVSSDGVDTLDVIEGNPLPGICAISPASGPSILPADHLGLELKGINFGEVPTAYFWKKDSVTSSLDTWMAHNIQSGDDLWFVENNGENGDIITTSIPYDEYQSDYYMPLGEWPISVKSNIDGERGNSKNYFVTDCKFDDGPPKTGLQCCTEGPDVGQWRDYCAGEERTSGYLWRFTTAIFPILPHVIERCDQDIWFEENGQDYYPSPIPSIDWDDGDNMCLNATIAVRFNVGMNEDTINSDTLFVYKCGTDESTPDCTYSEDSKIAADDLDFAYEDKDEPILKIRQGDVFADPDHNFDANTWYRVVLTTGIESLPIQISSSGLEKPFPLQIDKSIKELNKDLEGDGLEVAYYYDFRTGAPDNICLLLGAYIDPYEKTVTQLGKLMSKWELNSPFYYYIEGKADKKCTMLNVGELPWEWSSEDALRATITKAPSEDYPHSRAEAEALLHSPDGVEFYSSVPTVDTPLEELFPGELEANSSTLYIALGDPYVTYFEPNCAESCPNAIILAEFSRHMSTTTYPDGFKLYKCDGPNCLKPDLVSPDKYEITDQSTQLQIVVQPLEDLADNEYYRVSLNGGFEGEGFQEVIESLKQLDPPLGDDNYLEPTTWVFKTKTSGASCDVDNVKIVPSPHIAYYIGEKVKLTATPYSAPGECSKYGQQLNKWSSDYEYDWLSQDEQVADITKFSSSFQWAPFCSSSCLPVGSNVSFSEEALSAPLCGNGEVDPGEDCDVAAEGEQVFITCSLECLRPGDSAEDESLCGNGVVDNPDSPFAIDKNAGEQCDPAHTADGKFCNDDCTKKGSSNIFNPNIPGYCGDAKIGKEELCDIALTPEAAEAEGLEVNFSQLGCSTSCLRKGTSLAEHWCLDQSTSVQESVECQNSTSVCGNGHLENGEQCDLGVGVEFDPTCSNKCLFQNLCGTNLEQCKGGDEPEDGCNADCTLAGSSLFYNQSSVCGDGVIGVGEVTACELGPGEGGAGNGKTESPVQIATAIGEAPVIDFKQETIIQSTLTYPTGEKVGEGEYTLQCGFEESEVVLEFAQDEDQYTDCVYSEDFEGEKNGLGVGDNSCCYPRPRRTAEYPAHFAGMDGSEPVCPNTYIEATFDADIDQDSLENNVYIVRGYTGFFDCVSAGQEDYTATTTAALQLAYGSDFTEPENNGFWGNLWQKIKSFFAGLFGIEVHAVTQLSDITTWCKTNVGLEGVVLPDDTEDYSEVALQLKDILDKQAVHAVVLEGGKNGVTDVNGVGLKSQDNNNESLSDVWAFETGNVVCKIKQVNVDPSSHLFNLPNISHDFVAEAESNNGQLIVPIAGVYDWSWSWEPHLSTIFNIPADGASADTFYTKLGSTDLEGSVTALGIAEITADAVPDDGGQQAVGTQFAGETLLTSMFCENPWPAVDPITGEWEPYTNEEYNFSMSYCADAGVSGNKADDLPFFDEVNISVGDEEDSLFKQLFFNSINEDAIGIQIFKNEDRLSAVDWFDQKYDGATEIEVAGYDAVRDSNNNSYYINALNVTKNNSEEVQKVYSNIYLFSINNSAQEPTRNVFAQLRDSLEFNINLTDHRYCLDKEGINPDFLLSCSEGSDFQCNQDIHTLTIQEEEVGICGIEDSAKWIKVESNTEDAINEIFFISPTKGWYVGANGLVGRTTDNGASWSVSYLPGGEFLKGVYFINPLFGWVTGQEGAFYQTVDGGETWEEVNLGGEKYTEFDGNFVYFKDNTTGWVVENGNKAYKTIDGGETWQQNELTSIVPVPIYAMDFGDGLHGVAVGNQGRVIQTDDGGDTWVHKDIGSVGVGEELHDVSFFNSIVWIVGHNGKVFRSTDSGDTWESISSGINPSDALRSVYSISGNEVWIGGLSSLLYHTTDSVQTAWDKLVSEEFINVEDIFFFGSQGWIVGSLGSMWRTGVPSLECVEDADCNFGNVCVGGVLGQYEEYTSAGCHAEKTKLFRDWERLQDVATLQNVLTPPYPELSNGTFRKNYVNSKWPSWGQFTGEMLQVNFEKSGSVVDPINDWSNCGADDLNTCWDTDSSTFMCPEDMSIYEYEYTTSSEGYTLHVPMEYLTNEDYLENDFAMFITKTDSFTIERNCQPNVAYSFATQQCGDGVISPGEECDPPGDYKISDKGHIEAEFGECTYSSEEKECATDVDCPFAIVYQDGEEFYANKSETDKVCTHNGNLLYGNVLAGNEVEVFGCNVAEDCNNVNIYGEDSIIQTFENSPEEFEILSDFFLSGDLIFGCEHVGDIGYVDDIQSRSCVGAIAADDGVGLCPSGYKATSFCSDSCQIEYSSCTPVFECGNGLVEAGEACDDGNLNGGYGQCNLTCDGLSAAFCGNGQIDVDASGNALEFCELEDKSTEGKSLALLWSNTHVFNATCDISDLGSGLASILPTLMDAKESKKLYLEVDPSIITDEEYEEFLGFGGTNFCVLSGSTDDDKDGVCFDDDNCPNDHNPDQSDIDDDGFGDVCDADSQLLDIINETVYSQLANQKNKICSDYVGYCEGNSDYICRNDADCAKIGVDSLYLDNLQTDNVSDFVNNLSSDSEDFGPCQPVLTSYATEKENTCSWDCQGYGQYCGDGYLDTSKGEQCDDGNNDKGDGCNDVCKEENVACLAQQPYYEVTESGNNTYVYVSSGDYEDPENFGGQPIPECTEDTSGKEICDAYGLSCIEVQVWLSGGPFDEILIDASELSCESDLTSIYTSDADHAYRVECAGGFSGYENAVDIEETCGNGILQSGEECDDGNNVNGDGCSACILDSGCGNGKIDQGEQCDWAIPGTYQENDCVGLGYGESCVYCSKQCQSITVDSLVFCGNGKIDYEPGGTASEVCDEQGGSVVQHTSANGDIPVSCQSFYNDEELISHQGGQLSCTENCQVFDVSSCYTCGVGPDQPTPKIALLNPMIGPESSWPSLKETSKVSLVYEDHSITNASGQSIPISTNKQILGSFTSYNNYVDPYLPLEVYSSGPGSSFGIETTNQCNEFCQNGVCAGGYSVEFNQEPVSDSDSDEHLEAVALTGGDSFPYPVSDQISSVKNELVMSNAVPSSTLRVVIRWGDEAADNDGNYIGGFYSEGFTTTSKQWIYTDAAPLPGEVGNLCSKIELSDTKKDLWNYDNVIDTIFPEYKRYWWPIDCEPYDDMLYIHPQNNLKRTYIQSFTIDTEEFNSEDVVGFYVQNLSRSIGSIADKTSDLSVDIYTYQEGQIPARSIYLPSHTFTIKGAEKTSNNIGDSQGQDGAKYWHAFNLIKQDGEYQIAPIDLGGTLGVQTDGAIRTDLCALQETIPDAVLSEDCP